MKINWDLYRHEDGSLRLMDVWKQHSLPIKMSGPLSVDELTLATAFFADITVYQSINSRQVAALIMAVADQNLEYFRGEDKWQK